VAKQLEESLEAGNDVPTQRLLFHKLFSEFQQLHDGSEKWLRTLDNLFERQTATLAKLIKPDQMLTLLEHQDVSTFDLVLQTWRQQVDVDRLVLLRKRIAAFNFQPKSAAAAHCLLQLANHLAVLRPEYAEQLLTQAYPWLYPAERQAQSERVEHRMLIGRTLRGMHPQYQIFWEERLLNHPEAMNWNSPEAVEALNHLHANYGHNWHGHFLLSKVLPAEALLRIEKSKETMQRLEPLLAAESRWVRIRKVIGWLIFSTIAFWLWMLLVKTARRGIFGL
jgi:hypothetical protein